MDPPRLANFGIGGRQWVRRRASGGRSRSSGGRGGWVAVAEGPGPAPAAGVGAGEGRGRARRGPARRAVPPVGGGLVGQRGDRRARCARRSGGASSPSAGQERRAEGDPDVAPASGRLAPLRRMLAGALDVDRHDRHAAAASTGRRRRRGTAGPSRRAAAALGEDQHAPAVVDQLGGLVGGAPGDLGALDRDGADDERGRGRRDAGAEEVVGGRADEHLVAPRLGDRREQQRRVDVAVVVGGEDRPGPSRPSSRSRPSPLGRGRAPRPPGAARVSSSDRAGAAGPGSGGPSRCRSRRRACGAGRRRLDAAGHGGRASTGTASRGRAGRRDLHVTSAMRIGGLCRWVIGRRARPTTSDAISSASRSVDAGLKPRRRTAFGLAADDDHPAEVLRARGSPSTTCRTGGRRGRRSSCGRGGGTTRPRRTASRSAASISTGSVVSASTCSKKSM